MALHRDQQRADDRDVLDEFDRSRLRERSTQERTATAYTARVAAFVEWLPALVEKSLWKPTAATVIEWVNLEAARGLKASTLGKQLVMLRSFLRYAHRSGRTGQDLSGVMPHAIAWRLSSIPDPVPVGTIEALFDTLDLRSPECLRGRPGSAADCQRCLRDDPANLHQGRGRRGSARTGCGTLRI